MGHLSLILIILAFGLGTAASAHAILLYFQSKRLESQVQKRLLRILSLFLFFIFAASLLLNASQIFEKVYIYRIYKKEDRREEPRADGQPVPQTVIQPDMTEGI